MMHGVESDFLHRIVIIFRETMMNLAEASEELKEKYDSELF